MEYKNQLEIMNQQFKELTALYRNIAGQNGASETEFWVWYALLILGGEYSQQDICDTWLLPKQTVNSLISNLAKKELLVLEAVPGMRNRKIIRVTKAGRAHGLPIVLPAYEAEQRALHRMDDEERSQYIALLGKYIGILKEEIHA